MSSPTWSDEYVPEANCADCGAETIIKFFPKPSYPECDGFCDSCGCIWYEGISSITPERPSFKPSYQPPLPWGSPKVIITTPVPELFVVHSSKQEKEDPFRLKESPDIFPEDYQECKVCGYDHKYDASAATRKHKSL